ncbi:aminotransferase class V-fold PLP-dependent enzyme [Aporhodopirellula aestuarii]|uniref:cysteine desulfurase n=1 Tax=Aporhodopirellula aestuarii TaxID=2950107 RepID=A0ABT0U5R2_9BACT|nr:aminotransferase class V-fold PLP-dependent enzyme [Aporhodopirellula aestuarii]MCM2372277.1 aminotransferase class V-fold PLP-dependent enzyme [Aporhodopirellula aestuarii]
MDPVTLEAVKQGNEVVPRLYLDHASTSWPKATGVIEAMTDFIRDCGVSASRGNYTTARKAGELVAHVRGRLSDAICADDPSCISFHGGCTVALNVAIHGIVPERGRSGDNVITSAVEHNSVLRPLRAATRGTGAELKIIPCQDDGHVDVEAMTDAIDDRTRLVALTHASNVTGVVQNVTEVGRVIAQRNAEREPSDRIVFLCDAAQTFGYLPVDVAGLGVHLLAAPAHKGCGGPVGIAMLYVHPSLHGVIEPTIQGGTGHDGLAEQMPLEMPGRLEPGTINVPAIAGWGAALERLMPVAGAFNGLANRLHDGLRSIDGVRVVGGRGELPIASIDFGPMLSPAEAAAILDSEFGIEVRSGYHCAALLHECLGTQDGGTLRISCGHGTTPADVDRVIQAVKDIAAEL